LRILFDINHPAHIHLFKNAIWELKARGHEIAVTAREKEITTALLDEYEIEYTVLTSAGNSLTGLATEFLQREIELFKLARNFRASVYLSSNPAVSHISTLLGGESIIFHDSEHSTTRELLFRPFADLILTPEGFDRNIGAKQVRYPSYHELAYLHPNRFRPDPEALSNYGVEVSEQFFVLRFIAWDAHHDVGQSGFSEQIKREIISVLSKQGEVYVTSEASLPARFEEYRLPIPPHLIHDLLYYSNMYIGESGTMTTEAAILGTPAVMCNSLAAGEIMSNFVELENEYRLLFTTSNPKMALKKVKNLLGTQKLQQQWKRRRDRLLQEKLDSTGMILNQIEAIQGESV
jgi:predicted glycosyltransferase